MNKPCWNCGVTDLGVSCGFGLGACFNCGACHNDSFEHNVLRCQRPHHLMALIRDLISIKGDLKKMKLPSGKHLISCETIQDLQEAFNFYESN